MKSRSAVLLALLAFSLGPTRVARADFMDWTYTVSRDPVSIAADNGGSGGISLAVDSGGSGKTSITAVVLTTFSSVSDSNADTLTDKTYSVTLHITDNQNNSGDVTVTGKFNGSVSSTTFSGTNTFTSGNEQKVTIGSHVYDVTFSYNAPGAPNSGQTGSITATVRVTDVAGGGGDTGNTSSAPEPSSLLLAGLALPLLYRLRRRGPGRLPLQPA
jgi:hypothetical protein